MSARARTPRVMSPWGHVTFWVLAMLSAVVLVISGASAFLAGPSGQVSRGPHPLLSLLHAVNSPVYAVGAGLLLVALIGIWGRYWFLPSDLIQVVEGEHGSVVEQRGRVRRCIKARIRDLWLLADLDHPVFGYWPSHAARSGGGVTTGRRGLHPRHMLAVSRIELVRVGDFSALPEVRFQVTGESLRRTSSPSGFPELDRALRDAAPAMAGMNAPVTLEIRPQWLRVRVRGGSWLGGRFLRRIRPTIAFTERLVASFDDRFIPADPDAADLVLDHGELRLVHDTRYQTIRLDPAQAVADEHQNDRV